MHYSVFNILFPEIRNIIYSSIHYELVCLLYNKLINYKNRLRTNSIYCKAFVCSDNFLTGVLDQLMSDCASPKKLVYCSPTLTLFYLPLLLLIIFSKQSFMYVIWYYYFFVSILVIVPVSYFSERRFLFATFCTSSRC